MLEELELLRGYRAEVPEPDAATIDAARTVLMAAIASEQRPQPRSHEQRARQRRLQRRRRFVLAAGLAVVGIVIAGAVGFDTASAPQSALAGEMNQLARVAASQAWTGIPGKGQYLYTDSVGLTESDGFVSARRSCDIDLLDHRQVWIATNGSGALADTFSHARYISVEGEMTVAQDKANCAFLHTNPASQEHSGGNRFPAGGLSFPTENWKALSTDPATLLKQVHRLDGGPNSANELFVNVGDFLRESDAPPAIRAALYKAAALIPGVQLMGEQTDHLGRTGMGIDFPYPNGTRHSVLIFDQKTAGLLAEEYYAPNGKLVGWTSYIQQKIVATLPDYPMNPSSPQGS